MFPFDITKNIERLLCEAESADDKRREKTECTTFDSYSVALRTYWFDNLVNQQSE